MHSLMHSRREDGSDYPIEACPVYNVVRTAIPIHLREDIFWRVDGSSFPVEFSADPIPKDGVIVGTVVNFNDITARKQAEEQLRQLNATLEQRVQEELEKNREKDLLLIQQSRLAAIGEVIHNVSHHWRQPLSAVSLILANIKDAYEFNELNREYLSSEVAAGQRLIQSMSEIIDRFHGFFSADQEKQDFRICEMVNEAICLLTPAFKAGIADIEFERCRETFVVSGYPADFARVVMSVLTNARDAIARRNADGKISIRAKKNDEAVTVSILDNGGGIPADMLERVFDPYFTTKDVGTGLGLYLAKTIMENMGGSIVIHNIENGAEVLLHLPLANRGEENLAKE